MYTVQCHGTVVHIVFCCVDISTACGWSVNVCIR